MEPTTEVSLVDSPYRSPQRQEVLDVAAMYLLLQHHPKQPSLSPCRLLHWGPILHVSRGAQCHLKSIPSFVAHLLVLIFDPHREASLLQLLRVCHAVTETMAVDSSTIASPILLALKSWYAASVLRPNRTSDVLERLLRTVCGSG